MYIENTVSTTEGQCQGHEISIFETKKTLIYSLFEPIFVSIGDDDKKLNDMVIGDNASTIDSKTRIDQELKSEGQGQGQKLSIFKHGRKTGISS